MVIDFMPDNCNCYKNKAQEELDAVLGTHFACESYFTDFYDIAISSFLGFFSFHSLAETFPDQNTTFRLQSSHGREGDAFGLDFAWTLPHLLPWRISCSKMEQMQDRSKANGLLYQAGITSSSR